MTPELILHHEPGAPCVEKIRLAMGYKKLACRSVTAAAADPTHAQLLALTGGYRHLPVLQIGADIYCDSALICEVLEHVQPEPTLYPTALRGCARIFAEWADSTLYGTAMSYALQPRGLAQLASAHEALARTFKDERKALQGHLGHMGRRRAGDATSALKSYLRRIASMAEEHDFLFGAEPCIADFAAYHPLWFTRTQVPVMSGILTATPAVLEWMDRMAALGHARQEPLSPEDAITDACRAQAQAAGSQLLVHSAFQDDHGIALGSRVSITPETLAGDPVEGELLAATRTHYSLRRSDPRVGTVHVHFPRIGYALRPAPRA